MKQAFLNYSIKWITKYNPNYSEEQIEQLQYGLEGLYLTITKLIVISILSLILGIFKEMIIVLLFFNIIRYPAFGFHADRSITCLLFSATLFLALPYIMLHMTLTFPIKVFLTGLCLIAFALWAPADTPKRPLTNTRKRKIRKFASISFAIIYTIAIFTIKNTVISQLILAAFLIEGIMICPITYKIFHQPFNNYKKCISS